MQLLHPPLYGQQEVQDPEAPRAVETVPVLTHPVLVLFGAAADPSLFGWVLRECCFAVGAEVHEADGADGDEASS